MRGFSSLASRATPALKNLSQESLNRGTFKTKSPRNLEASTFLDRNRTNNVEAPSTGEAHEEEEEFPQAGATIDDPAQLVARALLCFNDRHIYSSCEESCRLTEMGNLDVPHDYTDQYCSGPCLTETHLVLNCIEGILANFMFYNKATIRDVRDTIKAACSYGPERGNFNVAEHMEAEENSARKTGGLVVVGAALTIIGPVLIL